MKRISLFTVAIMLTIASFAQSEAKFGLKGGLNIASIDNSEGSSGYDTRLGLNIGALAHIHINPQWAIQPELVFSSQGTKYTISNGTHQLALNYINIPVQLQYMFDNGFRIQTGPQLGLLVNVSDKKNGTETGFFTKDDFKSTDISWSFGLGYLTYSGLGFDARYNLGLSNINDAGAANLKNNVVQLGLFYLFDHTHKAHSR